MKTKIIISAIALALAGGVIWASIPKASAQTTSGKTIIQRIAEKFGLKETDVQTVFDQERTDKQAEIQSRYEERLAQAVKDGKITEAQKTAILAKQKEIQQKREQDQAGMQAWLKANGLENNEFGLRLGFGGKGMGPGRGMHSW
jgi:hypothetical protein